ncbi:cupin domain-containing protein [Dyadobacter fanqingshengii]|uniref:Cupin domain-containing protein n=1 Tax=Dyadobacter fanqingshengii TaxID=2906443 RepID=A0A9X1TAT9_9BACT|nr:cupin domain-containing protein [Dyadobacter fanqingshengii]MCF0042126.1 cupin domain-containing protein [Dyadobacter fanqingshengii]USJ35340.1 cupin domain-containing protein [Dyadobacter fanqingshengii]
MQALQRIDLQQVSEAAAGNYTNLPLSLVNDHVIRISIMTEPFYWHYHPNSDESFLCIEGVLVIALESETIELHPGQLFTIPKNVLHKTSPKGPRSVNLTFELEGMETKTE